LEQLRIQRRKSVESRFKETYDILEREEIEFEYTLEDAKRQLYEVYNGEQTAEGQELIWQISCKT
jgi:hypothetical protein